MDEPAAPEVQQDAGINARLLRLEAEVAHLQCQLAQLNSGNQSASETRPPIERTPSDSIAPPPPIPDLQPAHPSSPVEPRPIVTALPDEPPPTCPTTESSPQSTWKPHFGAAPHQSGASLEDRLGGLWFNRIGIVLLLLGTSWFLKLAIDRGWIVPSPMARVIAGLVAGAALVLWSERFRRQGFPAFSYSLKALGSGVLYLSLWAGFRLYNLLPAGVALGLMIAVTAWNAFMAWAQDAELLAAYALAGGFATPVLLSTGGNHEIFLFTYLLVIDAAAILLVRLKRWPRLLFAAFPVTVAYFTAWYIEYWAADALWITVAFIALFAAAFGTVPLGTADPERAPESPSATRRFSRTQILIPLANAAFAGLALYSVLQDSGHHAWLPWMVLLLAALYLAVMRAPQSRTAAAIHLSLAILFLTIAIPLKASGHWITAGWLVEGLALVWVASRLASATSDDANPARILRSLGLAALGLGFCGITFHLFPPDPISRLWSSDTATALLGIGVYAATAFLALRQAALFKERNPESANPGSPASSLAGVISPEAPHFSDARSWDQVRIACFTAIDLVAVLLALAEVLISWSAASTSTTVPAHPPFTTAAFGKAILALCILAGAAAAALLRRNRQGAEPFWSMQAALAIVTFNLIAVLTGVREVAAIWPASTNPDAALKQGLAISAYLMLYGAALLAIGFWNRSTPLRWQGLALLLFTILKTFLYDMRNLSQGYRVASFLALGALLMAISYAYQRDWLNLRATPNPTSPDPTPDPTEANHTKAG